MDMGGQRGGWFFSSSSAAGGSAFGGGPHRGMHGFGPTRLKKALAMSEFVDFRARRYLMEEKIDIKKISFGADTAEDDMNLGLPSYFQDTKAFEEFLKGKKYIIVGNRGSGKSAIFKKLQSSIPSSAICIEITPDKCSYEQLSATQDMVNLGKATIGAFQAGWKYMALILVLKEINKRGSAFKRGAFQKIHDYLRDNHANIQHDPITVLATYVLRIIDLLLNRGPLQLSGKPAELEKLYRLEELDFIMEDLKKAIVATPIYIFVDELDKGWDNSDSALIKCWKDPRFSEKIKGGSFCLQKQLKRGRNRCSGKL